MTKVNESIVRAIKAPEPTKTWQPVDHATLLDQLEVARAMADVEIAKVRYELTKDGRQMFGVWTFKSVLEDFPAPSIGFRNSIDKSLSIGLCAGTYVVVCSNLAFSGEWMHFRKHTKNVLEDLYLFALQAFGTALNGAKKMVRWQSALDEIDLVPSRWKTLTYDAIDKGVLMPSKVHPLIKRGREGDLTLGVWFNEITNVLTRQSLLQTDTRYENLKMLADNYIADAAGW